MNMNDGRDAGLGIISVVGTFLLLCYILIFPTKPYVIQAAGRLLSFIILGSLLVSCITMHLFVERTNKII